MQTTTAVSMSTIVTAITEIVTGAVSWITSYIGIVTSTPLLLFFAVLSVVGLGVGLIRRLIRL